MLVGILIITVIFALVGSIVSSILRNKFKKYSKQGLSTGLSGAEIAQKMLEDHNIQDVTIQSVAGKLTDHYNPANKTVNLSPEVYQGRSVAAAAVAAHEVGHAIQHATAYRWLGLRSKLVPVVSIASSLMRWVFMLGFLGFFTILQGNDFVLLALIAAQGALTLFALITLPVEFDASKRAMAYVYEAGITSGTSEYNNAKDALWWAGMTYFVAALASLTQLLYLIMIFLRRR